MNTRMNKKMNREKKKNFMSMGFVIKVRKTDQAAKGYFAGLRGKVRGKT